MWKPTDEMSVDECENEMHHLEDYFQMCVEGQHGISTKEVVRYRRCVERVRAAGRHTCPVM